MARRNIPKPVPPLDRERVLAYLAAHPGHTKRDVAKALSVRGEDRVVLKHILAELAQEGLLEHGKKKSFIPPGALPEVTVLEIVGEDPDGELLGQPAHWERAEPPPSVLIVPGGDDPGPVLGRGEKVLVRITRTPEGYEGRVIKHLGASVHRVLGVLRRGDERAHRVDPIDRKSRYGFLVDKRDLGGAEPGELVVVEPHAGRAHAPRGRIVERLGSMNEPKAVSLIAIHAHGIPVEFPQPALREAHLAKPVAAAGRTDLRDVPLVTIDPEDARDHDDAVWAGPDPDPANRGGHILLVAIADVAHYVTPASALDREAAKRGNSVYFPDRVVPMLPEALSADLCSLKENEDRPCLAVRIVIDTDGHKRRHRFMRGIMRSALRLTYPEAEAGFRGEPGARLKELHERTTAPLWDAYQALIRARAAREPLDLDLPERRIRIGTEGSVASIAFRERLDSMRLIEEFMVLANVCAAETLERARLPLIYRVHERPSQEKIVAFADYLRSINLSFAKGQVQKPAVFNRVLARVKGGPHEDVLNEVVLRTQSQAVYATENIGHFGLNLARYAHFTSPIRRYADLTVHRTLIRAGGFGSGAMAESDAARLTDTAEHISMTERRAMAAERDSADRYIAAYMEDRVGAVFEGRVTGATRFGLFIRLKETGADGLLPMRALGFEFFRHDEKQHALVGTQSGLVHRLGDKLTVRLTEAAPLTGGLRFELARQGSAAASQPSKWDSSTRLPKRKRTR